jgi:hypothetical protein
MKILFFKSETAQTCRVNSLYNRLKKKRKRLSFLRKNSAKHLVNDYYNSYSDFLKNEGLRDEDPKKLIVFGHKDSEFPVLLSAIKNKFIYHSWFNCNTSNSISVFFMKEGISLLLDENWPQIFKRWVAFEKFDFLNELAYCEGECEVMYEKIFRVIKDADSPTNIKSKIMLVFDESIQRLSQRISESENISMAIYLLLINKRSIECQN